MKTITIIIIVILGLLNNLTAQTSFSLNFTDTAQASGINNLVQIGGTLTNNTSGQLQMSMQLLDINIPSDWDVVMCDAEQCRPAGIVFSIFQMNPNQSAGVYVDFSVGNTSGIGTAKVKIENVGSSNGEVSIWTMRVDATITGVVNYSMEKEEPILTEWFTLQGQLIKDINNVPKGIYIQRLHFEDGTFVSTKVYANR